MGLKTLLPYICVGEDFHKPSLPKKKKNKKENKQQQFPNKSFPLDSSQLVGALAGQQVTQEERTLLTYLLSNLWLQSGSGNLFSFPYYNDNK